MEEKWVLRGRHSLDPAVTRATFALGFMRKCCRMGLGRQLESSSGEGEFWPTVLRQELCETPVPAIMLDQSNLDSTSPQGSSWLF